MNKEEKIINIAVVAHVDVGKSTLVDALLSQCDALEKDTGEQQIMDSNDLEKERGITIYSKNCSIRYKDYKINIVDTPGHAIPYTIGKSNCLSFASNSTNKSNVIFTTSSILASFLSILFINKIGFRFCFKAC